MDLYVFAGANGSGKSTFINAFYDERKNEKIGYICPDCIETVLSTQEKIEFILKAKETGYTIHIVYITTISPEINILWVKNRVLQGGHDVPTDKLLSRYHKSLSLLPKLIKLADDILIYDNSSEEPILIYSYNASQRFINPDFMEMQWFRRYVVPFIQSR